MLILDAPLVKDMSQVDETASKGIPEIEIAQMHVSPTPPSVCLGLLTLLPNHHKCA